MNEKIEKVVLFLLDRIMAEHPNHVPAETIADEALKYTQAAVNLLQVRRLLAEIELYTGKPAEEEPQTG